MHPNTWGANIMIQELRVRAKATMSSLFSISARPHGTQHLYDSTLGEARGLFAGVKFEHRRKKTVKRLRIVQSLRRLCCMT